MKLTPVIPIIGYVILFNEHVVEYARLAGELGIDKVGAAEISDRLLLLYLGLTALAVGSLIYSWKCPDEIKLHATSRAYIAADGASIGDYAMSSIEETLRTGEFKDAYVEIRDRYDITPEQMRQLFAGSSGALDQRQKETYKETKLAILQLYYDNMNAKSTSARFCVTILFLLGFSFLMFVAAPVFLRVVVIALHRWL